MITKLLLDFFIALVGLPFSWLPTAGPPAWFHDGDAAIQAALAYGAGLGAWIPWAALGVVVPAVIACLLVGVGIKVVRMILSLFTGGGGSAA